MTEEEKGVFCEIARQVLEWMKEDWNQTTAYCHHCTFPDGICDLHEEWGQRIERLESRIAKLSPEELTERPATAGPIRKTKKKPLPRNKAAGFLARQEKSKH